MHALPLSMNRTAKEQWNGQRGEGDDEGILINLALFWIFGDV
jgi:hypothetical protein